MGWIIFLLTVLLFVGLSMLTTKWLQKQARKAIESDMPSDDEDKKMESF